MEDSTIARVAALLAEYNIDEGQEEDGDEGVRPTDHVDSGVSTTIEAVLPNATDPATDVLNSIMKLMKCQIKVAAENHKLINESNQLLQRQMDLCAGHHRQMMTANNVNNYSLKSQLESDNERIVDSVKKLNSRIAKLNDLLSEVNEEVRQIRGHTGHIRSRY